MNSKRENMQAVCFIAVKSGKEGSDPSLPLHSEKEAGSL
jgi:hypothetical protein